MVPRLPSASDLARLRAAIRNPLLQYQPGPPHKRFLTDPARFRLLRAPSQSGKTTAAAWELIHRCLGTHPYLGGGAKEPPIEARVVCHSYRQSLVIQRKIDELMPDGVLAPGCTFHPVRGYAHKTISFANGSRVTISTTSQERLALASATLDLIWIDEPPDAGTFSECTSRLVQTGGQLLLTLTPVGRPLGWLRDAVEAPDSMISETHFGLSVESCPWMTESQVEEAIRACLPSQRPQVIYGDWDGVTPDRMIEGFDDTSISTEVPTGTQVRVLLGFDHGIRPGAEVCLLAYYWRDRRGDPHLYVLDEYVSPGRTTEMQDALAIQRKMEQHGLSLFSVDLARGDVNAAGKSAARFSVNQTFDRAFRALAGSQPFVMERPRKGPGSVLRAAKVINSACLEGRLRVHPRCKGLVESLRHWRGDNDNYKHLFDALGYLSYDLLDGSRREPGRIAVG